MILLIEQLQLYWTQSPVIVILALLLAFLVVTFAAFLAYLATFPKLRKIIPRRADHFRPDLVPSNLDTIVIGSGSGGSCCANLLAQSGQRVLVLEQHTVTGGCTFRIVVLDLVYETISLTSYHRYSFISRRKL